MLDDPDELTPIDRPLLRSDINEIRDTVHGMSEMLLRWYEENKTWRQQSDELAARVGKIERNLWLPAFVSVAAAALALLARLAP